MTSVEDEGCYDLTPLLSILDFDPLEHMTERKLKQWREFGTSCRLVGAFLTTSAPAISIDELSEELIKFICITLPMMLSQRQSDTSQQTGVKSVFRLSSFGKVIEMRAAIIILLSCIPNIKHLGDRVMQKLNEYLSPDSSLKRDVQELSVASISDARSLSEEFSLHLLLLLAHAINEMRFDLADLNLIRVVSNHCQTIINEFMAEGHFGMLVLLLGSCPLEFHEVEPPGFWASKLNLPTLYSRRVSTECHADSQLGRQICNALLSVGNICDVLEMFDSSVDASCTENQQLPLILVAMVELPPLWNVPVTDISQHLALGLTSWNAESILLSHIAQHIPTGESLGQFAELAASWDRHWELG